MRWLSFPLLASLSLLTSIWRIRNHVFKYDPVAALLTTVSAGRTGSLLLVLGILLAKDRPPFCPYKKGDQTALALPLRPTASLHRREEVRHGPVEQVRLLQIDGMSALGEHRQGIWGQAAQFQLGQAAPDPGNFHIEAVHGNPLFVVVDGYVVAYGAANAGKKMRHVGAKAGCNGNLRDGLAGGSAGRSSPE